MGKKERQILTFITAIVLLMAGTLWINKSYFYSLINDLQSEPIAFDVEKESCVQCHTNTKGYSPYHNPELIGCAACHLGTTDSFDKDISHGGMVLIPGNLSDAKETCGKCHVEELKKIENSLMTTNSGLIAVDKFIFGEADHPNGFYHIDSLKFSAADKHIRDLCANCHLGAEKTEFGAIGELSRGGGCNACHLNYSMKAKEQLKLYLDSEKNELPMIHPSTTVQVTDMHCFGCHSRSSRISTNYEGWQETLLDSAPNNSEKFRTFQDKRVYEFKEADVHHNKGLLCIDCHSSHEVMGTGEFIAHAEDAVTLQCSDCHFKKEPMTIAYDSLDQESLLVFLHRKYEHSDRPILAVQKDGHPLINTYIDSTGNAWMIGKGDNALHKINPQSETCAKDLAHKDMSCSSCHASWSSRCIGCHNEYNPKEERAFDLLDRAYGKGQWQELVAEFSSAPPSMGVRFQDEKRHIEPAIPGMILTIDHSSFSGNPDDNTSFHRLYAPNSPHTIQSKSRDCASCHLDPLAIGYGMGILEYVIENGAGTWMFIPDYAPNENDGLPEDSWIPFLQEYTVDKVSTRTNFRPFNLAEQKRILRVGACLSCHTSDSAQMQESLVMGLGKVMDKMSKNCILPTWKKE